MTPTFENCLGLSILSNASHQQQQESDDNSHQSAVSPAEKHKNGPHTTSAVKKRQDKAKYKQVNYLQVLNKAIDNAYIDLTTNQFVNILQKKNLTSDNEQGMNYYA